MTPDRSADFADALALVRPISRRRLYSTARSVFVSDQSQAQAFDSVFSSVFGGAGRGRARSPTTRGPRPRRPTRDRARHPARSERAAAHGVAVARRRRRRRRAPRSAVPLAMASDEERAGRQELRRARPARAGAALPADVAPRARDTAAAHPPLREGAPRPAHRHAADAARQPALRRRPDPPRAPAPAHRPPPARDAVRHLGLDGALRPRLPAVPGLRRRQRSARRGVRFRHPAHPAHPRARLAPPGAGDPARRGRGAGLVERDPDRRRAQGVQRPPRAPRHGPRGGGGDPLRRLGARRPDARGPRDGAPRAPRPPDRLGQSARGRQRVLRTGRRHGRPRSSTATRS